MEQSSRSIAVGKCVSAASTAHAGLPAMVVSNRNHGTKESLAEVAGEAWASGRNAPVDRGNDDQVIDVKVVDCFNQGYFRGRDSVNDCDLSCKEDEHPL